MFKYLRKLFIPHEDNNHRPHFLRKEMIRLVILFVLITEVFAFIIPTINNIQLNGGMAAVLPAVLSSLTNHERESQSLHELNINPILSEAAKLKAEDMASNSYFEHTSPSGKTPWYWLEKVGYSYEYAGENLAINFIDSEDVTKAWMESPTHKANILKDKYTEIGTGIATGLYEGTETVFVAQIFAKPVSTNPENNIQATPTKANNNKINMNNHIAKNENVLGVETEIANIPREDFSSIKSEPNEIQRVDVIQKFVASPRNSSNYLFLVIFIILSLSLILNILIKFKHHHVDLVTNGLVTIGLVGAVIITNHYITHKSMVVLQTINYTNPEFAK